MMAYHCIICNRDTQRGMFFEGQIYFFYSVFFVSYVFTCASGPTHNGSLIYVSEINNHISETFDWK